MRLGIQEAVLNLVNKPQRNICLPVAVLKSDGLCFLNTFSANKDAILRSVDPLHYVCYNVLLKLFG